MPLVVPHHSGLRLILAGFALGAWYGIAAGTVTGFGSGWAVSVDLFVGLAVVLGLLVGSVAIAWLAARKWWAALGLGIALYAGTVFFWTLVDRGLGPAQIHVGTMDVADWFHIFVECWVQGAVFGLIVLAAWALLRAARLRPVVQTGDLCWRCAYPRGSERITVCPECGTGPDHANCRFRAVHRVLSALGRTGPWLAPALLIASALYVAAAYPWTPALDKQFWKAMERAGWRTMPWYYHRVGDGPLVAGAPSVASEFPLDPARSLVLMATFRPDSLPGDPPLQLEVASKSSGGWGASYLCYTPRVLCDLREEHVEALKSSGVPESLKAAMLAAAAVASPASAPPAAPGPDIRVDPEPHFQRPQ